MGIECEVFVKRVGLEQARKFVGFYDEAVTYVEERLAALDIDCDYTPSGIIRAAVHPSQRSAVPAFISAPMVSSWVGIRSSSH